MRRMVFIVMLGMGCLFLVACVETMTQTKVSSTSPQTIYQAQIEPWQGPKARIAVMEFVNKTGVYYELGEHGTTVRVGAPSGRPQEIMTVRDPLGWGMEDQLITALAQTGAFILIERAALEDIMREQELAVSGRARKETVAPMGEIEGADFLIYGAVTEYQPSQASVAVGGGARPWPTLSDPTVSPGSMLLDIIAQVAAGAYEAQDYVAIDLRLVDARTGRIVGATSVEGRAQDLGGAIGGTFGTTLIGLSGQYQTPIQKAVRACMIKAANWIAGNTLIGGIARAEAATLSPEEEVEERPAPVSVKVLTPLPQVEVVADQVNIRAEPTLRSERITMLPRGSRLDVLNEEENWLRVFLPDDPNDRKGWVHRSLVKEITPSEIEEAPASVSLEERLTTLRDLLQKGLITEEEYQSKRKELLGEL